MQGDDLRRAIVAHARFLEGSGINQSTSGNLSVRCGAPATLDDAEVARLVERFKSLGVPAKRGDGEGD